MRLVCEAGPPPSLEKGEEAGLPEVGVGMAPLLWLLRWTPAASELMHPRDGSPGARRRVG
jgi:hypothetical protein